MTNSFEPIEENKRTAIIDILRGWALLGVVIVNYVDYSQIGLPNSTHNVNAFSQVLGAIQGIFFVGKSWTLLSILFGYGFAMLINNIASKDKNPVTFFVWRMCILFIFAFIDSAFWSGDILKDYAFLGLTLLFFYRCSAKTILLTCLLLFISMPFVMAHVKTLGFIVLHVSADPKYLKLYHSNNWLDVFEFNLIGTFYEQMINLKYIIPSYIAMFTCMLLGFYTQKIDFFNRLYEFKKQIKIIFFVSLIAAIIIIVLYKAALIHKASFVIYFFPLSWFLLSSMLFIASGIYWLYCNNKLKTIFSYFRVSGKMTLTNYMVQNILAALIFSGAGLKLYDTMPYWFYFMLAVLIFIIQLFISKWWLSKFNYGPIEWLWRVLSYRKLFAFKRTESNSFPNEINAKATE